MLVLSAGDVEAILDLDELADAVQAAMVALSGGDATMPNRVAALVPERDGLLAAMPAYLPSAGALTTKLVSLFPHNTDRPTHQALICCFDPANGTPVAVMDGTTITAARTAAGSAVATRLLARPDAAVVTVIGTGVQAYAHARALARLAGVDQVVCAGRNPSEVARLVGELVGAGIPAVPANSIEEAVRRGDIVCATTHTSAPVVRREWLRPGCHVNSVGYNSSGTGEVDVATVRDAVVVVESRAAALAAPPAGAIELRRAIDQGVIAEADIAGEIGEIASGRTTGRTDDDQLTLYKSVGVAVQDAAAAALVLRAARLRNVGLDVAM
jgi:ornithine cyclodeaminase/alanine dehydrogenase-like protein (mu-crystallin family)